MDTALISPRLLWPMGADDYGSVLDAYACATLGFDSYWHWAWREEVRVGGRVWWV